MRKPALSGPRASNCRYDRLVSGAPHMCVATFVVTLSQKRRIKPCAKSATSFCLQLLPRCSGWPTTELSIEIRCSLPMVRTRHSAIEQKSAVQRSPSHPRKQRRSNCRFQLFREIGRAESWRNRTSAKTWVLLAFAGSDRGVCLLSASGCGLCYSLECRCRFTLFPIAYSGVPNLTAGLVAVLTLQSALRAADFPFLRSQFGGPLVFLTFEVGANSAGSG